MCVSGFYFNFYYTRRPCLCIYIHLSIRVCIITETILQFVDLGLASVALPGEDNISAPISPSDGIKMFGVTYENLYVSCILLYNYT